MIHLFKTLHRENKIRYIVDQGRTGALVYLILPLYTSVVGSVSFFMAGLSVLILVCSTLRFFWPNFRTFRDHKFYLPGFYLVTGLLSIGASLLAAQLLEGTIRQEVVLFNTIFIATTTSAIMVTFSAEPFIAALLGGLILFPFSWILAAKSEDASVWILMGSFLYHLWNLIQIKRTHANYIQLQESKAVVLFQERRLREFINSLPGYVSWFDENLNYLDANERLVTMSGLSREVFIGASLGFSKQSNPLIQIVRTFRDSNEPFVISEMAITINGSERHLLTTLMRYRSVEGTQQISVLSLDVTTLKEEELELEKRKIQVATQEKFAALGEMAGGIAHEINNPLAIIRGKTDLLLANIKRGRMTEEILLKHLEGIGTTVDRITNIVKSLKTLIHEGRIAAMQSMTVGNALEPLLEILTSRVENMNVQFQIEREGFDYWIECGGTELGQVLMNLVVNSAQAVAKLEERWVRLSVKADEHKVYLYIMDSGKGLSPEVQKKLFQPFFTTKAIGVGTGLGLSLSKELMHKQQGDLYYDNNQPHTTFVIEFKRFAVHVEPLPLSSLKSSG